MSHKISVITAVYNVADYLDEFFQKMISQTYQKFKIFAVYDHSTDNSLAVLRKYEDMYPDKMEVLISPKKDGLGAARDFALDNGDISGEYVIFLDPDDYPEPNFLERLVEEADGSGADITICGFERFDDDTGKVYCTEMINNPSNLITDIKHHDILAYMPPAVWNKLYRRDLIGEMRFTNIKRAEDLFFLLRLLPKVKSIKYVNEVLYHYRIRHDSLSHGVNENEYKEVLKGFRMIKKVYDSNPGLYDAFAPILELAAFVRCVLSITLRVSLNEPENLNRYVKKTYRFLNETFPDWERNRYLRLRLLTKRGFKGIGIWGVCILFRVGLYRLFFYVYAFLFVRMKVDVKW